MSQQITSQVFTIFEFFNHYKDYQLVIPIYQRKYEWGKEQCETLFNDLFNPDIKKDIENGEYLLGNILFQVEGNKIYIIDGQQRLTSLLILLSAIRKNISVDDVYFKYNENKPRLISERSDTEEINSLENIILKQNDNEYKNSTICRNFRDFAGFLDNVEDKNKILTNLEKHIKIVAINLGSSKVQTVFEKSNSTGKPLSEVDLIRNYTLMNIEINEQKELSENYWKVMEDEIKWENGEQIGLRIDYIIYHFVIIKLQVLETNELFKDFKRVCQEKYNNNIFDVMKGVLETAWYWGRLSCKKYSDNDSGKKFMEDNEKLREAFEDLNYNGDSHYTPFIKMYQEMNSRDDFKSEFAQIAHQLDTYWVRKYASNSGSKSTKNRISKRMAILELHLLDKSKLDEIFDNAYNKHSLLDFIYLYDRKTNRKYNWKNKEDNKKIRWYLTVYNDEIEHEFNFKRILANDDGCNRSDFDYGYDTLGWFLKKLVHKKTRKDVSNYSIEHIAPQTPTENWKVMFNNNNNNNNNNNENQKEYFTLIGELGNLTLLTSGDNSSASNGEFGDKLKIYEDKKYENQLDVIFMKDIINKSEWTADDIEKRTRLLAEKIAEIWSVK